jgi:hypothetical protein
VTCEWGAYRPGQGWGTACGVWEVWDGTRDDGACGRRGIWGGRRGIGGRDDKAAGGGGSWAA